MAIAGLPQSTPWLYSSLRQKAAVQWHSTYGRDVLTLGQSLNSDGKCKRSLNSHRAHGNSFFNFSSKKPSIQKIGMWPLLHISQTAPQPRVHPQIESRECLGAEDGGKQECSVWGLAPQDSSVLGRTHCRRDLKLFSSNLRVRFRSLGFHVFRMEETMLLRQAR